MRTGDRRAEHQILSRGRSSGLIGHDEDLGFHSEWHGGSP